MDRKGHHEGEKVTLTLSEEVTFLNKASIMLTLDHVAPNSEVVIDASRSVNIDDDVLEIIHKFRSNAAYKNIKLTTIDLDRHFAKSKNAKGCLTACHLSTIFFPNGTSEISTSLKCCRAKGIPMMVMARSSPNTMCPIAIHNPPHRIQTMLSNTARHPPLEDVLTAIRPKGQRIKPASLKHCSPNGIPMMVQQRTAPPTR